MRRCLAYMLSLMLVMQTLHAIADAHVLHQDHGIAVSDTLSASPGSTDVAPDDSHHAHHHHCCQSHAPALVDNGHLDMPLAAHMRPLDTPPSPLRLIDNLFRPPIA